MFQINNPELETVMTRDISFPIAVDEETKKRLLIVAEKCPVSKILKNKITIPTTI
jgi:putative redox protein